MTTTTGAADKDSVTAGAVADSEDVPDWLAAMRPVAPTPALPETVPAPPAATSAPRPAVTPPGRQPEPMPALLGEDDLPAWLMRLGTDAEPSATTEPPAPPASGVPAWFAPTGGAAPTVTTPVSAEIAPPVWGARESKAPPPEAAAGAAIFASLAAAPVAIEMDEPTPASTTPAPGARRAIPWWWFAVAAAVLLLLVVLLVIPR